MFELSWQVDETGYDWIERHFGRTILTGRQVCVLRHRGGSLRSYSPFDHPDLARRFAQLRLGRKAVLEFVNKWGVLDEAAGLRFDEISARRRALASVFSVLDHSSPTETQTGVAGMAAVMFNEKLPTPLLKLRLVQPDYPGTGRPRIVFAPQSLWGALLVQTATEIGGLLTAATCLNCGTILPLGPGKGTRRRKFCSDRCRKMWHRNQPKEDRSNG